MKENMKHYDLIIIGSGWGTKLRPAADRWKKVAIIEKSELWGTCLNKGCIPSKMLIYPSDLATHIKEDASRLHISGWDTLKLDFEKIVSETTKKIRKNSEGIQPVYEKHENIDFYHGHARFVAGKVIEVNGEKLSAERIYIATGSKPHIPNIPGLEGTPYMTSKEALRNTKKPEKMIIIGWGYIAVELGHAYGAMGVDVHFLVRSGMIKAEDKDVREEFERDFSKRYNVHFGVSPTKIEYRNETFFVHTMGESGKEKIMQSDALFVATWVVPVSDDLWLENTKVQMNEGWYIKVDEYLATGEEWVYALWDVVGNYLFRHSVNYEGEYLFMQHYGEAKRTPLTYPPVPHAIFSYPQIAGIWLTEDELMLNGKILWADYEIAIHKYEDSAMGMASKPEVWFVKLIAEKGSGKLLGAHIIGEKSADIIHMMIVLISAGETVDFMVDRMIFIHPALSEVIRNAARTLQKKI